MNMILYTEFLFINYRSTVMTNEVTIYVNSITYMYVYMITAIMNG